MKCIQGDLLSREQTQDDRMIREAAQDYITMGFF